MREEAERVVAEEGWTKAALNNMVKIDSFLRESQRINNFGPCLYLPYHLCELTQKLWTVGMVRKVVAKDGFRFSDGTVLPYGAYVSVASRATHYDNCTVLFSNSSCAVANTHIQPANYENAAKFDGFRFARERAEHHNLNDNQDIFKRQMISTAADHLVFGTGKHACPVAICLFSLPYHSTIVTGTLFCGDGTQGNDGAFGYQLRCRGGGGGGTATR